MRSSTRVTLLGVTSLPVALALAALHAPTPATAPAAPGAAAPAADAGLPWELRADGWRTDRAWYDGRAEKCTYEASRVIYGRPRSYVAIAYTNKQRMDPATTVKAAGDGGFEAFKHHWSERVPTEAYDYDFSTATFTRADDLSAYKLTAATQEDCGASFKQAWRADGELRWLESVYFPGAGLRQGALDARGVHFADALPLVLRDYPFDAPRDVALTLVPFQKDTHRVPFTPRRHTVRYERRATLELPVGAVDAHLLELVDAGGSVVARFGFAADGSAPWLHALVYFEGPAGTTYRLRSHERTAYWERA